MSDTEHIMDSSGKIHRLAVKYVPEWDFAPVICGGGVVLPNYPCAGPPTCEWCQRGEVEPGYRKVD